jgi:outer membrane protein assembly factor BamB
MSIVRGLGHTSLLIAILLLAGTVRADARAVVPQATWQQRFASADGEYEYKAGALAGADASIWLVVGRRAKGQLSGPQSLWLWQLDAAGTKQREIDLAPVSPRALSDLKDVAVRPDGSLLLIGQAGDGLFVLIGYDPQRGERLFAKDLSRAGRRFFINRFVVLGDDRYVVVGRAGSSGAALAVRGDGEPLWEQTFTGEKVTVLSDGVRMDDGRLMVVGSHLDPGGSTSIWVGTLDASGKLTGSTSFAGRYAAIARAPDGQYAVLFDARGAAAWDVSLRGLTPDLREVWTIPLVSDPRIVFPFRVSQVAGGEVVIVGAKDGHLWVARVGTQGKMQWSTSVRDEGAAQEDVWNYGVLSAGDTFVVPYSTMIVNDKMEQRQELRVVKAQVGGR